MTSNNVLRLVVLLVSQLAFAGGVFAQDRLPDHPWSHGTNLELLGAASTAPDADVRGVLGAAIGWDINKVFSIKGSGAWVLPNHDDDAFAADIKALVNLTRPNVMVPFVGAGFGLYRASFGAASTPLPDFYKQRVPDGQLGTQLTFTDPAFLFEGGVKIFAGRRISLRPDVSVRLVTRGGATYAVTMAGIHVTYHFEVHDEIH